jgi:hypothetical protein
MEKETLQKRLNKRARKRKAAWAIAHDQPSQGSTDLCVFTKHHPTSTDGTSFNAVTSKTRHAQGEDHETDDDIDNDNQYTRRVLASDTRTQAPRDGFTSTTLYNGRRSIITSSASQMLSHYQPQLKVHIKLNNKPKSKVKVSLQQPKDNQHPIATSSTNSKSTTTTEQQAPTTDIAPVQ